METGRQRGLVRFLRGFAADTSGAILPYATLLLVIIVGGAVLGIDGARLMNLQSQLQKGADALALAGAAELDRRPDSILRANEAIDNLVTNNHVFGEGAEQRIAGLTRRYLRALPPNDADPIDDSYLAADATEARFVEVTANPQNMTVFMPAGFSGGPTTASTGAQAVAGFDAVVCKFTPIYICNPYEEEPGGVDIFEAIANPEHRKKLIELRPSAGGGGDTFFPGNFGFLEPSDGPGANNLGEALSRVSPNACFYQNGVNRQTGYIQAMRDAINTRFDMYNGSYNGKKGNPAYRPAQNVRKGYVAGQGGGGGASCNTQLLSPPNDAQAVGLKRDTCFYSGTCTALGGGRLGNGDWDLGTYWSTNHPGTAQPPLEAGETYPPSRYRVYQYEIQQGFLTGAAHTSPGGEIGAPICYNGGGLSDNPDRRVMYGAVLNCNQLKQDYGLSGSSGPPVPVLAFGKFFLTEPVENAAESGIFVELIDLVSPGGPNDDVARDIVQLYR